MMANNASVGFSVPSSPQAVREPTASSPTTAGPTTTQQDFKTWFFQTASFNHPTETSRAASPKQLRRVLRRAWKALERSPYYKSLRGNEAANSSPGDMTLAESGISRSAPGSPPSSHRGRFRKNKAKSTSKTAAKKGSPDRAGASGSDTTPLQMRPGSAQQPKVRPFSAGSVGSTSSSEASEGVNTGDDRRLIPLSKRLFPSAKVRPKSSGILKHTQMPDADASQNRNVYFSNVDETAAGANEGKQSSSGGEINAPAANKVSMASRRASSAASSGRKSPGDSLSIGSDDTTGETASGKHRAGDSPSVHMVIDSSNAGDVAQLGSIPEVDGGTSKGSKPRKTSAKQGGDSKKPFADLKIIDETASMKSSASGSAKGSSKSSGKRPESSSSKAASNKATPGSGSSASSSTSKNKSSSDAPKAASSSSSGKEQITATKSNATTASTTGATGSVSFSTGSTSGTPVATADPDSRILTSEGADGDGASSKGSKDKSDKSSKEGGTKSALKKAESKESKDSRSSAGDKDGKEGKSKDGGAGSTSTKDGKDGSSKQDKDGAGSEKDSKSSKSSGKKDGEGKGKNKSEGGDGKTGAGDSAAAQGGAHPAATPGEGSAPTPTPGDGGDKAPLKREMSRISVKTNESRKSIDMSKHIMNLIHGGQAQEEQIKKPQSTNQSYIQQAIPALPMAAAVMCLLLNLFAPGCGTVLSGVLVICVGKPRIEAKENAVGLTIFVNSFVGISQLMTVTFFFVGWFWSMVWGINFIINSIEYGEEKKAERERELQQTAMRAFGFIRAEAAPAVDE